MGHACRFAQGHEHEPRTEHEHEKHAHTLHESGPKQHILNSWTYSFIHRAFTSVFSGISSTRDGCGDKRPTAEGSHTHVPPCMLAPEGQLFAWSFLLDLLVGIHTRGLVQSKFIAAL